MNTRVSLLLLLAALAFGGCTLSSALDDRCEFDIHHGIKCKEVSRVPSEL